MWFSRCTQGISQYNYHTFSICRADTDFSLYFEGNDLTQDKVCKAAIREPIGTKVDFPSRITTILDQVFEVDGVRRVSTHHDACFVILA